MSNLHFSSTSECWQLNGKSVSPGDQKFAGVIPMGETEIAFQKNELDERSPIIRHDSFIKILLSTARQSEIPRFQR